MRELTSTDNPKLDTNLSLAISLVFTLLKISMSWKRLDLSILRSFKLSLSLFVVILCDNYSSMRFLNSLKNSEYIFELLIMFLF